MSVNLARVQRALHKCVPHLRKSLRSAHHCVKISDCFCLKMKTLHQLALQAVPNPGFMADKYLVPWHPIVKELQERQYTEDRNCYREEHRVNFRCVYEEMCFIEAWFSNSKIYSRNVAFLDRFWTRFFGSKIQSGSV